MKDNKMFASFEDNDSNVLVNREVIYLAGIAKPSIPDLGEEAIYELIEGNGNNMLNGTGLFDGNQVNEWNTNKVFYWYAANHFVKIKVGQEFRIWRSGTTSWNNRYQPINIKKVNDDGTEEDFTSYHLQTTSITQSQWEAFTEPMPAGTYVFGLGFWGSGGLRIDSEWYIEALKPPTTNKTLILSNGEYKKYEEGSPATSSDLNAIPVMTSDTYPMGKASSSGVLSNDSRYQAYKAFDGIYNRDYGYVSNTANCWLNYEFHEEVAISKYRLASSSGANGVVAQPKKWIFEGSNNGVNYTSLQEIQNETGWGRTESREYTFKNLTPYKHYRIRVLENNGYSSYTSIGVLEMFELSSLGEPSSWQTVSTTLPTTQQFQEEGMEDLSILDRKVTAPLYSPIQMNNTGSLGEGKVFKGTVDLKKYFDLRKLEVK